MDAEERQKHAYGLLQVSTLMEELTCYGDGPSPRQRMLRDAVRELSFVCGALLKDAEEREIEDARPAVGASRETVYLWLSGERVGTFVQDRTGDVWRKDPDGWRCWDAVDQVWGTQPSSTSELMAWAPYILTKEPVQLIKVKVGDGLYGEEQLDACFDGTIVLDNEEDAWQKVDGSWYCARTGAFGPWSSSRIIGEECGPFTVLYVPERKESS